MHPTTPHPPQDKWLQPLPAELRDAGTAPCSWKSPIWAHRWMETPVIIHIIDGELIITAHILIQQLRIKQSVRI